MNKKIFHDLIGASIDREGRDFASGTEKENILSGEEEREQLLELLPEEIRERSLREKFSLEHIKKIIEFREQKGLQMVTGFHVSPRDIRIGESITPGEEGRVYFSTSIEHLYLGKGSGYIYAMECSRKLMEELDKNLHWYTLKGQMKIIDKIKMTPDNIVALGAKFAECNYS